MKMNNSTTESFYFYVSEHGPYTEDGDELEFLMLDYIAKNPSVTGKWSWRCIQDMATVAKAVPNE